MTAVSELAKGVRNMVTGKRSVVIHQWAPGFRKVHFTQMLRRELGFSLSNAKQITDDVLANKRVELTVNAGDEERIAKLAMDLGVYVIQNHVAMTSELRTCR